MPRKRTLTLNLTDAEMKALEVLSEQKELSKTAVMRQALRLYQLLDTRMQAGKRIILHDELCKKSTDLIVL